MFRSHTSFITLAIWKDHRLYALVMQHLQTSSIWRISRSFYHISIREQQVCPHCMDIRKLKQVVKSTLSAETIALEESLKTCFMIKSFLVELIGKDSYQNIIPICCHTDNKSLVDTINSTKTLPEKRLPVDICIITGMTEKQEVKQITWCDVRSQLADCLTKVGASCNKLIHVIQGDGKLL